VIPVFADVSTTRACIESVFACSGDALGQLIVVNDCSPDPQMMPVLNALRELHPEMVLISNETNLGFVRSANRGIGLRLRDVVLLNSDTRVTPGWLPEMLEVADVHDRVAAVVPLSNNGAICSVPSYCQATEMRELVDRELKLESLPQYTTVPTGVGFCLLLKNIVLNMIGGFDPAYGRGYNEENDWAMRAQTMGFVVLRANRALVFHLGTISFDRAEREKLDFTNTNLLLKRYPYFLEEVKTFSDSAEARIASSYVRRRMGTTSVCISFRHLDGFESELADRYPLELAQSLKEDAGLEIFGLVKTPAQERALAESGIASAIGGHPEREQIFHSSGRLSDPEDLRLLLSAPGHAVITSDDLIAWRTPSAHRSIDEFERYRTRLFAALHSAQAVIAQSNHHRDELLRDFHLPPGRVHTVYPGVDVAAFERRDESLNRSRLEALAVSRPYFLYLGTDYAHKNLKLLLNAYALFRYRFPGGVEAAPGLIFAGVPSYSLGSIYDRDEPWPAGVRYLGRIDADDARVLHQEALACVFPSAYEAFGWQVLEAFAAGAPVICSSLTSLPEVAGDAALYIRDFSPEEIAKLMLQLSTSPDQRRSLIGAGRRRAKKLTWRETSRKTAELYEDIIAHPVEVSLFQRSVFWGFLRGIGARELKSPIGASPV